MARVDEYAKALVDSVAVAVPAWVERSVRRVLLVAGRPFDDELRSATAEAAAVAGADVTERVAELVGADVDAQATTPLTILRAAVGYPAVVLREAGVPPLARDGFSRERFPDDDYDLTPATWGDVDEALVEPGLAWGASKAKAHMARHRGGAT